MTVSEDTVRRLVADICGTDEVLAEPDLNLFDAGLMDSLGMVELLVDLGDRMGVDISPTEVDREDIDTLDKIVAFVQDRQAP